jgi:hypothetical protein
MRAVAALSKASKQKHSDILKREKGLEIISSPFCLSQIYYIKGS